MKIDWKQLSKSPGYKSLKACYVYDVTHRRKSKKEALYLFRRAISMAQHYAVRLGKPVEDVLNEWEETRDYWWSNFYPKHNLPKLASGKSSNVRPTSYKTYVRKHYSKRNSKYYIGTLRRERTREAKEQRKKAGKKARWPTEKKASYKRVLQRKKDTEL